MSEASATVAAAQLLAFCKDPVHQRPRLTHGREIASGGVHVFRFAQGKFAHGLLRDLPAAERERLRRAAILFIRQICFWDGATHYQVLCVPLNARRETIKEHYQGLIALIHPDRQEPDSEHWPPEAAHRVNLAYAVLTDAARRADYDTGMHKSGADRQRSEGEEDRPPQTAGVRVPVQGWFAAARIRCRKPVLLVTAAIATVFYLQTWWAVELAQDYGVLESATPLEASRRWMRNVFAASDRPNYLAASAALPGPQAQLISGGGAEPESLVTPVWKAFSGGVAREDAAMSAPSGTVRAASGLSAQPTRAQAPDVREDPQAGRGAADSGSRPSRSPPDASPPPASPPLAVAGSLSGVDVVELEILVARLVTYYERGDLEQFMALFDADSYNVLTAAALRADFQKFFRETRERRLWVQRLTWEVKGETTRGKGNALIDVEYRDPPERLERPTKVEVVVRVRDGKPKVAALSLFPRE